MRFAIILVTILFFKGCIPEPVSIINTTVDLSPIVDNQKIINDNIATINNNLAVIVDNQDRTNENLKILQENVLNGQKVQDQILKQSMHNILEDNIIIMDYLENNCSGKSYG